MTAQELLQFFSVKTWIVKRSILDQNRAQKSSFNGVATIKFKDSLWLYEERGEHIYDQKAHVASRRYQYQIDGDVISVNFEDGKLFYQFTCDQLPHVSFDHLCGDDHYSGQLFIEGNTWKTVWKVSGPKKNLTIETEYS